jgi:RND family efflux transporter MFP subunit
MDMGAQGLSKYAVGAICVTAGIVWFAPMGLADGGAVLDTVRGIVKPQAEATISSELIANVVSVPFKTGERFRVGEPILRFDCRRYGAELSAARAELKSARLTLKLNQGLRQHMAIGQHDLAISAAKLEQVEAELEMRRLRQDQCVITAPFDGRIVERLVNEHEMPQPSKPLLKIIKEGALELGLVVPSNWLVWLRSRDVFRFRVEETQTVHQARVLRVGAMVDPISRTVNVEAQLLDVSDQVRPGMSGKATFTLPKR